MQRADERAPGEQLGEPDENVGAPVAWPAGFAAYRRLYPLTPPLGGLVRNDVTVEFARAWREAGAGGRLRAGARVTLVIVRGLFGEWIPGHFARPLRALQSAGVAAIIAKGLAAGTVEQNAARLAQDIERRVDPARRLILLCHSKGGLDALAMLQRSAALRERTAALVLCQTPRGPCAVLESLLLRRYRDSIEGSARAFLERLAGGAIGAIGARPGCLELTAGAIAPIVERLGSAARGLPVLCVASWSSRPSAWLDAQHARLAAIRPGCAHDGLFYLEDLIWPLADQVLLPELDHAQPTVGGAALYHGRLWRALTAMAFARAGVPQP